jgi:hypothetical protein
LKSGRIVPGARIAGRPERRKGDIRISLCEIEDCITKKEKKISETEVDDKGNFKLIFSSNEIKKIIPVIKTKEINFLKFEIYNNENNAK